MLIVLGGAGVALLTSALRSRGSVPRSSMVSFRRSMTALGRRGHMRPRSGTSGRRVLVLQDPQRVAVPRGRPSHPGAGRRGRPHRASSGAARGWLTAPGPAGERVTGAARRGPPTRPRQTAAARRRRAVLRALIAAVLGSSVAWATLGTAGTVLLVVALVALAAYGVLLVSVAPAPPPARRPAPGGGRAARPRAGAPAAGAEQGGSAPAGQGGARRDQPVAHGA